MNSKTSRLARWPDPSAAWVALMVATVTTTWVFSTHNFPATTSAIATFVLVSWKVRLIVLDFMELRASAWVLRLAFEAWAVVVPGMILAFYLAR